MEDISFPNDGLTYGAVNVRGHGAMNYSALQKLVQLWNEKEIAESYMALPGG